VDKINLVSALIDERGVLLYYDITFTQNGKNILYQLPQDASEICLKVLDKIVPQLRFSQQKPKDKGQILYFDYWATISLDETGKPILQD
jgi:hypothetical protein